MPNLTTLAVREDDLHGSRQPGLQLAVLVPARLRRHVAPARAWGRWGGRMLRYSLVSLVSIAVSQAVLVGAFGLLHWTARLSNVLACAAGTVPSYYLNRSWAWGRRGRSQLWKEVVPFWALAFGGLAFSTWAADLGSTLARQAAVSHAATTAVVMGSSLLAFGVLWVGKFAIFNALLFAERQHGGDEART